MSTAGEDFIVEHWVYLARRWRVLEGMDSAAWVGGLGESSALSVSPRLEYASTNLPTLGVLAARTICSSMISRACTSI